MDGICSVVMEMDMLIRELFGFQPQLYCLEFIVGNGLNPNFNLQ